MILHGSSKGELGKKTVALVDAEIEHGALTAQFFSSPAPSPGTAPKVLGGSPR